MKNWININLKLTNIFFLCVPFVFVGKKHHAAGRKNISTPRTGLRFFTVYGPWGRPDMFAFSATIKIHKGAGGGVKPWVFSPWKWEELGFFDRFLGGIPWDLAVWGLESRMGSDVPFQGLHIDSLPPAMMDAAYFHPMTQTCVGLLENGGCVPTPWFL